MSMNIAKAAKETFSHKDYAYRFSWIHLIRPMTFTGTISPILAGTALAANKGPFRLDTFIGLLIASLMVQSSANMLNDYYDFKHGQDLNKWCIQDGLDHHHPRFRTIPIVTSAVLLAAAIIGLWLASQSSYWIILVGILGIIFGFLYSGGPRPLSSIGLGEVTAAIFLGFVPTILGYVIQGFTIDVHILVSAIPFALLISSMILTNNIRDLEKDQLFRRTLAMILGRVKAAKLVTVLILLPYLWVLGLIFSGMISWTSAIIIIALPLALKLRWAIRADAAREDEISAMKIAAQHHWAFGLLLAIGLGLGSL